MGSTAVQQRVGRGTSPLGQSRPPAACHWGGHTPAAEPAGRGGARAADRGRSGAHARPAAPSPPRRPPGARPLSCCLHGRGHRGRPPPSCPGRGLAGPTSGAHRARPARPRAARTPSAGPALLPGAGAAERWAALTWGLGGGSPAGVDTTQHVRWAAGLQIHRNQAGRARRARGGAGGAEGGAGPGGRSQTDGAGPGAGLNPKLTWGVIWWTKINS